MSKRRGGKKWQKSMEQGFATFFDDKLIWSSCVNHSHFASCSMKLFFFFVSIDVSVRNL